MENQKKEVWFTVLVAALGYFVDIFDLQLFNVIGKASLGPKGLNLSLEQVNYFFFLVFHVLYFFKIAISHNRIFFTNVTELREEFSNFF